MLSTPKPPRARACARHYARPPSQVRSPLVFDATVQWIVPPVFLIVLAMLWWGPQVRRLPIYQPAAHLAPSSTTTISQDLSGAFLTMQGPANTAAPPVFAGTLWRQVHAEGLR